MSNLLTGWLPRSTGEPAEGSLFISIAKRRFLAAKTKLDTTIDRIIQDRRAGGEHRGDLLSMLLKATDTEGDGTGMSDEQRRMHRVPGHPVEMQPLITLRPKYGVKMRLQER